MADYRSNGRLTGPRTSRAVVAARAAACVVSLAVLGTSGFAWYTVNRLNDVSTSDALDEARKDAPKHLDKSINVLLIGLDSRVDMDGNPLPKEFVAGELHAGSSEIGAYNTNSMIVLHIPPDGGKVEALSIPRDDYVQTYGADGRMHKIKEAYDYAKAAAQQRLQGKGLSKAELEHRSREAGRSATIQTIQKLLDIPIDHFAEVNLVGFYDIAKAIQPITVCLNHAVNDPIIPRVTDARGNVIREGGGTGLKLPAGENRLDAAEALSFVRQRHNLAGGDLDRTHRQQAFIASVEYKLKQQGVFGDLGKLEALLNVVKKDVVLDNQWNVLDFAQQAPNLTGGNVEFNTLPITGFRNVNGQDVNVVDPALLRRIVQQLFGYAPSGSPSAPADASSAPAGSATVDVYNGSPAARAAATESKALTDLGFTAGAVDSAATHARHTTVTYGRGARDAADQIAARYNTTATALSNDPAGHIVVTLGADYSPPGPSAGGSPATPPATGGQSTPNGQAGQNGQSTQPSDGTTNLPMSGAAVKAGGIPCVD